MSSDRGEEGWGGQRLPEGQHGTEARLLSRQPAAGDLRRRRRISVSSPAVAKTLDHNITSNKKFILEFELSTHISVYVRSAVTFTHHSWVQNVLRWICCVLYEKNTNNGPRKQNTTTVHVKWTNEKEKKNSVHTSLYKCEGTIDKTVQQTYPAGHLWARWIILLLCSLTRSLVMPVAKHKNNLVSSKRFNPGC